MDDHLLRKSFPASDTQKEMCTKEKLENKFATIKSWRGQMRLKLNADKTKYITSGSRIQLHKVSSSPLTAGNDVIQMSSNIKYLERNTGQKAQLQQTHHHKNKESHVKLHTHKGNVEIPFQTGMQLHYVLMLCILHLDYGNALLYGLAKKSIKRLQTAQNMCAKLVLQCSKYLRATQALMDLHWLPIEQQIQYNILTITYKGINNIAPRCIMDLIEISKPRRDNMWSNNAGIRLNVPPVRYKTFAARSFHYVAATLWNALSKNIRESKTLDKFKQALKTHMYRKAFNT